MIEAKKRLRELRSIEIKIAQDNDEIERLRSQLGGTSIKATEKVQTSQTDRTSEIVSDIVDLTNEIKKEIRQLIYLRYKIIKEIHQLKSPAHIDILYRRYVKCQTLQEAADEMHYTLRHVIRLHGRALQAYGDVINKKTGD